MDLKDILTEIIPPSDYQHRNGFNNIPILEKLSINEKHKVENALITMLTFNKNENIDTLIIETLAYLKSEKSLPKLYELLKGSENDMVRLKIATSIFEINSDCDMANIAIASLRKLDNNVDPITSTS